MEAIEGVSNNKIYRFGLNAHSSSILATTPISCSTSQAGGPSESASTTYSATSRAIEMTQEYILTVLMNP